MSITYNEKTWVTKELITTTGLNNMEGGIANVTDAHNTLESTVSTLSSTVTSNKSETDTAISTLTSTVSSNKTSADNSISEINTTLSSIAQNSASSHNGIFRGKDLTSVYTIAQIHEKVNAGTFDDLFIGDYIDVSMTTTTGGTETVRWVFAGFDNFLYFGDTAVSKHHIVMVPYNSFKTISAMNETNTTAGAFVGSAMWTTVLPEYATAIQTAFGTDYVLSHRRWLSTTMTSTTASMYGAGVTGASTACEWTDVICCLMNEAMVFGCNTVASSRFDTDYANILPLFSLAPHYRRAANGGTGTGRYGWWLSSVVSARGFALVGSFGYPASYIASGLLGVRPYFLFC